MVNAPQMLRERRGIEINQITASIRKALEEKQDITYEKLLIATMSNLNLSRVTAQNYIDIALYRADLSIDDVKQGKYSAGYKEISGLSIKKITK